MAGRPPTDNKHRAKRRCAACIFAAQKDGNCVTAALFLSQVAHWPKQKEDSMHARTGQQPLFQAIQRLRERLQGHVEVPPLQADIATIVAPGRSAGPCYGACLVIAAFELCHR